jgi:hypothetical protein
MPKFFSLAFYIFICSKLIIGRPIIFKKDCEKLYNLNILEYFKAQGVTLSNQATTDSYEAGIIQCFGETTTTGSPMEEVIKNNPFPSLCNNLENSITTVIFCFGLLTLWIMLMASAIIYQVRSIGKVRKKFRMNKEGKFELGQTRENSPKNMPLEGITLV